MRNFLYTILFLTGMLMCHPSFAQYCGDSTSWGGSACGAAGNIYITTAAVSGTTFYSDGTCGSPDGYNDLTADTCYLMPEQSYILYLKSEAATANYGTCYGAWIDFNHNDTLTDAGETIIEPSANNYINDGNSLAITSDTFTVPIFASGITRMRILVYGGMFGFAAAPVPCGSSSYYGEYKDFTVNVGGFIHVGVESIDHLTSIKVYPNPVQDKFTIHLPQSITVSQIRLSDLAGRKLLEKTSSSISSAMIIPLPDQLPDGIYFLSLITNEGVVERKIMVMADRK